MKKQENNYIIPIGGLPLGLHDYQYVIDDSFFEMFEYSEVKKGIINLNLSVEKQETMYVLTFNFEGKVQIVCDRCNDEYEQLIEDEAVMFLKYGAEYQEESDDVIVITREQNDFDVSTLIYEFIILALPVHRTHSDVSQCNQEVISYLENSGKNEEDDTIDPRWSRLEDLKKDIEKEIN